MKILKNIFVFVAASIFVVACNEGIDSITPMDPGPDQTAPQVTISFPVEGTQIQLPEVVSSVNIKF